MLARKEAAAALANDAKAKDTAAAPEVYVPQTCPRCYTYLRDMSDFLAHPQGGTRCRQEAKLPWVALWRAEDERAHANKPH